MIKLRQTTFSDCPALLCEHAKEDGDLAVTPQVIGMITTMIAPLSSQPPFKVFTCSRAECIADHIEAMQYAARRFAQRERL